MFYNGGQFIKGYRTASSPLLPDNIEDLLEDLGSSFDTVGVNYNVNTIPSGRGDVYAYSPDMFGNCLQYPVAVTSSVATAKGWESISDMPSNMIYQVNNTVPDSFGLKWSGANSTLIIIHLTRYVDNLCIFQQVWFIALLLSRFSLCFRCEQ